MVAVIFIILLVIVFFYLRWIFAKPRSEKQEPEKVSPETRQVMNSVLKEMDNLLSDIENRQTKKRK